MGFRRGIVDLVAATRTRLRFFAQPRGRCFIAFALPLAFALALASPLVFAEARAQTAVDECALGTDTCGAQNLCGNTATGFVCGARCPNGFVHGSNRSECAETCPAATHAINADRECAPLPDNTPPPTPARTGADAKEMCENAGWTPVKVYGLPGANPNSPLVSLGYECPIPYRDAAAQRDESGCWLSSPEDLATARAQSDLGQYITTASQLCQTLFAADGVPLFADHDAGDRYFYNCSAPKERSADLKTCACPAGHADSNGSCVDIDECAADANICGPSGVCANTIGGHACQCGDGHANISNTLASPCADINECALGTDTCGAENLCGHTETGFVCGAHCPNGFAYGSARTECAETCPADTHIKNADNYCHPVATTRMNDAAQMCTDAGWILKTASSGGTYLGLVCPIPYRDAAAQSDEDECWVSSFNFETARSQGLTTASRYCWDLFTQNGLPLTVNHNAGDRYVHTCPDSKEPSADLKTCVCPDGYATDRDGSCVDINECAADANSCGPHDTCVNTIGGHACQCGPGHVALSGTLSGQCGDVDECATGADTCGTDNLCENTHGGFTCTPCPAGFMPNGDRGECVPADAACLPGETRNESGVCVCDTTLRASANGQCAPTASGAAQICEDKGWEAVEVTYLYREGRPPLAPQLQGTAGSECRIPYRNAADQTDERGCILRDDNDMHNEALKVFTLTTFCAELFLDDALIPLAENHNEGDRYVYNCPAGFIISDDLKECVCPQGRVDIDGICADINECTDETHACGENSACVNTSGSYQCVCESGYAFESPDNLQCAEVDECADATDDCGASALCANTEGGFVCGNQCPSGFIPNADRSECVEANPCPAGETRDQNGNCMCDPQTRFINTGFGGACHIAAPAATQMCRAAGWNVATVFHNGSVTLGAVCEIPYRDETAQTDETGCSIWQNYRHPDFSHWSAHQTTSQRCRDLFDARPVPTTLNHAPDDRYVHSCPGGKIPTADSRRCVCPEGWSEGGSGMCDIDIDECATGAHACGDSAQCVNTEGGHACECAPGHAPSGDWTLQNPQCADVDECAAATDDCGANSLCGNSAGGFVCGNECPDGLIPNDDRSECVAPDACPPLHVRSALNGLCVCDLDKAAFSGGDCVPRDAATTCETAGWPVETHEFLGNILKAECLIPLRNATTRENEGGCFLLPPADGSLADYQTDAVKTCHEIFGDSVPATLNHAPGDRYVHTCPGMKTPSADRKTCECPSGYEENADGTCVDTDECAAGAHSCGDAAQCVNTVGGHACECAAGYVRTGDWTFLQPQCGDVNECALGTDDCGHNTLCGNLAGGFVCEAECPEGTYVNLLRTKCVPCPPGEAQDENGNCVCDPETRFRNTGYGGACHLTSDGATETCLNAGWLVATVAHNNNVLGAVCKIPYRDETAEADETGCSIWHHIRHPDLEHWGDYETTSQRCRDLFDAYSVPLTLNHVAGDRYVHSCPPPKTPSGDLKSCDCPAGYQTDADGNCADIDECESGAHTCGANAQCANTPGGHICSCAPGYASADLSLQNLQCEDIDECATGAHSCGAHDSAFCVNTPGDYECACYVGRAPLNPTDPKNPGCLGTYDLTLSQSANGTLYAEYGGATVSAPVNYVPQGATVSVVASPDPEFYILEWGGNCANLRGGNPKRRGRPKTCRLTMDAHKTAGATYEKTWTTQFSGTLRPSQKRRRPANRRRRARRRHRRLHRPAQARILCARMDRRMRRRTRRRTRRPRRNANLRARPRLKPPSRRRPPPRRLGRIHPRPAKRNIVRAPQKRRSNLAPRRPCAAGRHRRLHRPTRPRTLPARMERRMRRQPSRRPGRTWRKPNLRARPQPKPKHRRNLPPRRVNRIHPQPRKRNRVCIH